MGDAGRKVASGTVQWAQLAWPREVMLTGYRKKPAILPRLSTVDEFVTIKCFGPFLEPLLDPP